MSQTHRIIPIGGCTVPFELRQYRTRPGQREDRVKFMEETIIPLQVSNG